MAEFVSEPITPVGRPDPAPMARGEPGLPPAFRWRGELFHVVACVEAWKFTSSEGGRAGGDVYLRRHYFRLRMSDEREWVIYFVRQTPMSGSPKRRWFLYEIGERE